MFVTESFQILATLAAVQIVLALAPGPNALLAARAGMRSPAHGLAVVCGVWPIGLLWAVLALVGLGAIFTALPSGIEAIRILGGLHLLALGVRVVRRSFVGRTVAAVDATSPTRVAAFRSGLLAHAANPRAIAYYMAVFAATGAPTLSLAEQAFAVVMMPTVSALWNTVSALMLARRPKGAGSLAERLAAAVGVSLRPCLACDRD